MWSQWTSGTSSQTPDLENCARQVDRVVNKTRRRVVDSRVSLRHVDRRVVAIYDKLINCNPLNPTTAIRCGFVIQLVSTVGKTMTDVARRAVRLQ